MRSQSRNWATLGIALVVLLLLSSAVPGHAASAAQAKASPDDPVDLNKATVESLTTIPGIGKVTAERIVEWRETNGPFRRIEDLMKVKGIGEKSLEKIRPYIRVGKGK